MSRTIGTPWYRPVPAPYGAGTGFVCIVIFSLPWVDPPDHMDFIKTHHFEGFQWFLKDTVSVPHIAATFPASATGLNAGNTFFGTIKSFVQRKFYKFSSRTTKFEFSGPGIIENPENHQFWLILLGELGFGSKIAGTGNATHYAPPCVCHCPVTCYKCFSRSYSTPMSSNGRGGGSWTILAIFLPSCVVV